MENIRLENVLSKLKGTYYLLSLLCDSTLTTGLTLDKERTQSALFAINDSFEKSISELTDIALGKMSEVRKQTTK